MSLKNLKELRKNEKLNQHDMADCISISYESYSEYENEKRAIPSDILIRLSKYFNVSTDYILDLSDCRSVDNGYINEKTGLSDDAINYLHNDKLDSADTINMILEQALKGYKESPASCRFLQDIHEYLIYKPSDNTFRDVENPKLEKGYVMLKMKKSGYILDANKMSDFLFAQVQADIVDLKKEIG